METGGKDGFKFQVSGLRRKDGSRFQAENRSRFQVSGSRRKTSYLMGLHTPDRGPFS